MDADYLRQLSQEPSFWKEDSGGRNLDVVKFALAVAAAERGECAKLCEIDRNEILLLAGEMTPQELRTVTAVLKGRAAVIRRRGSDHDLNQVARSQNLSGGALQKFGL